MSERVKRRVRLLKLLALCIWLALLLPVYALTVFGGLALTAVGRRLIAWSDTVHRVARVESGERLLREMKS